MSPLLVLATGVSLFPNVGVASGPDTLFVYDGTVTPDQCSCDLTTRVAHGASWYSDGQRLHMISGEPALPEDTGCAYFGSLLDFDPTAWSIPTDQEGADLRVRASVAEGSESWYIYVDNGTHFAYLQFVDDQHCRFRGLAGYDTLMVDTTVERDYRLVLRNGVVTYFLDGVPVFSGSAALTFNTSILIGDGLCATPGVNGELVVDHALLIGSPADPPVGAPEPGSPERFTWGRVKDAHR